MTTNTSGARLLVTLFASSSLIIVGVVGQPQVFFLRDLDVILVEIHFETRLSDDLESAAVLVRYHHNPGQP